MKILYFGTVCNSASYEKILSRSHIRPSAAPFVFENALAQGFAEQDADVEVFSFPVVPSFPKNKTLFIKGIKNKLDCGIDSSWIPAINISGLKQKSQGFSSKRMLKKWLKENSDEKKAVLIYSIYQPIAKSIVTLCHKYSTKCFAIVPDLPRDMYANQKISPLKKLLTDIYTRSALIVQDKFDGYIYLTEHMKNLINPSAPYTVVEGIANASGVDFSAQPEKSEIPSIMYAGALNEKMGIKNLLKAFSEIKTENVNLWLFGGGDCKEAILAAAKKDSRIKFFGYRSREEILQYERKAHLLINIRDCSEEYTKYSFPSKTIEYMLSGTPLLTTKLPGIPDEYFNYVFTAEDTSAQTVCRRITEILSLSADELHAFGLNAQKFISDNKNPYVQSGKIIKFIYETL